MLEHADTEIGTIYLGRRHVRAADVTRWIYEINIDGALLMSSSDPVSERRLSTAALDQHDGHELRMLVGGLGLGYTAQAALESPRVASLCVVEKLGSVIDWMNDGLLPLSEELAANPRLEIVQGDIYEDLLGPAAETYDLIVVDVDHAPRNRLSEASEPFYTEPGQARVARHLSPGGVLAVWSAEDDEDFLTVLCSVYPRAHREHVEWDDAAVSDSALHNVLFFGHTR